MSDVWSRIDQLSPEKRAALERLLAQQGLERPRRETPFVAPRSPLETTLARIWERVLGSERVGIDDDFFALGGDSIHSIQVVARARQEGVELSSQQLFDHPTIARLAAVLAASRGEHGAAAPSAAATLAGPVPLTPIQRWFFDLELPDPAHWNQALWLELDPVLAETGLAARLQTALTALAEHHAALRLRFLRDAAGWRAEPSAAASWPLERLTLATDDEATRAALAERLHTGLDLEHGPLARAALVETPAQTPRLLIVVHHLAVDAVSLRILAEDLALALAQQQRGEPIALPAVATSWPSWARHLEDRARSPRLAAELETWLATAREHENAAPPPARLPLDVPTAGDHESAARELRIELASEATAVLLRQAPLAARASALEVLLAAVVSALGAWSGERSWRIDVEGHGRESFDDEGAGLDTARTVGWLTSLFPLRVELPRGATPAAVLREVKGRLRALPRRGASWGLLRWLGRGELRERLAALPPAQVMLNYLGQLDAGVEPGAPLRPAPGPLGPLFGPAGERPHALQLVAAVTGGRLELRLLYPGEQLRAENAARLAGHLERALVAQLETIAQQPHTALASVDFPAAGLGAGELARLFADGLAAAEVEEICPLSPTQEGMLFHALASDDPRLYREQGSALLHGGLDPAALARAWQGLVARHGALRTSLRWRALPRPLQIVHRRAELPFALEDWRGLAPAELERRLAAAQRRDRERIGELERAPLTAVTLARLDDREQEPCHRLLWSLHHLVHDAWSIAVLLDELLVLYAAERSGEAPALAPARPYSAHVAWLAAQPPLDVEFWRARLAGVRARTPLPARSPLVPAAGWGHREHLLEPAASEALAELARRRGLTVSSWLHAAWALVLAGAGGPRPEVLFGTVLSGRPEQVAAAERAVGLYIVTLPLHARLEPERPLAEWVDALQRELGELRRHQADPLVRLQELSGLPRGEPLFETLVVVQNVLQTPEGRRGAGLTIREVRAEGHPDAALTLRATPGPQLRLELLYERSRLDDTAAESLLATLTNLLRGFCARPETVLAEHLAAPPQPSRGDLAMTPKPSLGAARGGKISLDALLTGPARTVSIAQKPLVEESLLDPARRLPLVLRPAHAGVDLLAWAAEHKAQLEQRLLDHGGILLRGFQVGSPERFEALVRTLSGEALEYRERSSPRSSVSGRVYTSTDYPADQPIFLHNENSYAHSWPLRIFFYCQTPPASGGETPIADVREVYRRLPAALRRRFEELGVLYLRNFSDTVGLSWRTVFQTEDRAEVEAYCRARGYELEWLEGERLRTRRVGRAAYLHPQTGEPVWFNHATFFHVSTLPEPIAAGLLAQLGEEQLPNQTRYGDGTPIEPETLATLRQTYAEATVQFPWQQDDVLMLDNMLVAHARRPYTGARKILTAMALPVDATQVSVPAPSADATVEAAP